MKYLYPFLFLFFPGFISAQTLQDDFEGAGNITTWYGDDCNLDIAKSNPYSQGINTSATVLEYHDIGGQYANVRFDAGQNLNLANHSTFVVKVYVPSSGITGNQANQISLKLQDGSQASPWQTQSEIIKPIVLDQWQTITFDFATDPFINLDPTSLPPTQRTDFNRVLFQLNGENNNDQVLAYLDDFVYVDTSSSSGGGSGPIVFDQLVWSDEFNGSGMIDTSKWFQQTQLPLGNSWYNGEIQHYTNRMVNSSQSNGTMKLVAKKETFTDQGVTKQYTSARLNSKFAFTYGRVEIRAIMPRGAGTWPAMWMLGQNIDEPGAYWQIQGYGTTPWPACGEIDIMEHWGTNQDFVQSAMHTPSSFGGTINKGGRLIPGVSDNFHVYALEWSPTKMVFSVDSIVHYVYEPAVRDASTWPFDDPQFILLNIAIEAGIDPSFLEDTLEIDYVRIYQSSSLGLNKQEKSMSMELYPNPTNGIAQLIFPRELKVQNVEIRAMNGSLVKSEIHESSTPGVHSLDLSTLEAGIYFVHLPEYPDLLPLKVVKR